MFVKEMGSVEFPQKFHALEGNKSICGVSHESFPDIRPG
jgi:hypothetical protein